MEIKAADVMKLRKMTGAGMMDCKKALAEAEGDFARAQDIIREKGKLVVAKRADRTATEGVVVTKIVLSNSKKDLVWKSMNRYLLPSTKTVHWNCSPNTSNGVSTASWTFSRKSTCTLSTAFLQGHLPCAESSTCLTASK